MKNTVVVYRSMLLPYSETFIKEQILACERWRAILLGRHEIGELPLDGVDVRVLEPGPPTFYSRARGRLFREMGWAPSLSPLRGERPRLLHVHFGTDAVKAVPIARALGIPMLVTLHGYDINISRAWWESGRGGFEMRSYPRRLLELSRQPFAQFIAVSEALRPRAIDFGIPSEKITVCHIGVDVTKFSPGGRPIAEREPRVLFVGRLVEKKGCKYLIEAMAEIQKSVPAAKLIIIGDGPLRKSLEHLAGGLGVNAEFRGAQRSSAIKRELDLARAFCLPSITAENGDAEGFGLVSLEAQAAGVPVITSALGGASEGLLQGVTGWAIQERSVSDLRTRLATLLTDDNIAAKMATAAREFVTSAFDLRNCTARLEDSYDRFAAPLMQVGAQGRSFEPKRAFNEL